MEYEAIFSARAEYNLEKITKYLQENWSNRVKIDFLVALTEQIQRLELMPFINPIFEKNRNLRRCLINKNTALFYRIDKTKIINVLKPKLSFDIAKKAPMLQIP